MKSPIQPLLPMSLVVIVMISSCSKVPLTNPPIPITVLQDLEQFPFQNWLDSINGLAPGIQLTIQDAEPVDPLPGHGESAGQLESAFAFRSSTPGAVTSLGVLEPSTGYTHEVTLWDSATGQVLADVFVKSLDSGHWTYNSLALVGQEVPIAANHGYIVGFNTLAVGSTPGAVSESNDVFLLYGLLDYQDFPGAAPGFLPIFPFTKGPITYEAEEWIFYDTPVATPPFPGPIPVGTILPHTVLGVCDIGFIPEPQ
jgi:hypothetical protein